MAESQPHQRRFPRIRSENPILVKKVDDETVGAFSKTQEVGLGGCMFATTNRSAPGRSSACSSRSRDGSSRPRPGSSTSAPTASSSR